MAGCRRLWVLVNGLPPESAVWRVDGQQWTNLHELLALNAEVTDWWGRFNAQLKSTKRLKTKPLHVPRPGEKEADRESAKAEEEKDRYQMQKERVALFS